RQALTGAPLDDPLPERRWPQFGAAVGARRNHDVGHVAIGFGDRDFGALEGGVDASQTAEYLADVLSAQDVGIAVNQIGRVPGLGVERVYSRRGVWQVASQIRRIG